jgi:PAS domain-containing protein
LHAHSIDEQDALRQYSGRHEIRAYPTVTGHAAGEGITYMDDRARTLFGVPAEVDHGAPAVQFWEEHLHLDDRQDLLNARTQLRDEGADRISKEYRYLHPDLGLRWLHHLSRIDIRDACGKAVHLIGVIR